MTKSLNAMKATVLDDDAFRLLALPFGGPFPFPGAPRGVDLDRQWFSEDTDFGDVPKRIPVTWHHGADRVMGKAEIAEAGDLEWDDEGGWVTVWLKHGERRLNLVKKLVEQGAERFGSSEARPGTAALRAGKAVLPWTRELPGEITRWHYYVQTLSTSPQNTKSVMQPIKATLADLASHEIQPTAAFFNDLARFMDNLASDLPRTSGLTGEVEAKAGRVLAARNEARLRAGVQTLDERGWDPVARKRALAEFAAVLGELDQYITDKENP
jgi:hypothetical protein